MAQDVRLLKICNFWKKAFIANNPKAEYDTPQCKNKANVYKSRGKTISRNVIHTDDGLIAKVIKEEIGDRIIKRLNKNLTMALNLGYLFSVIIKIKKLN